MRLITTLAIAAAMLFGQTVPQPSEKPGQDTVLNFFTGSLLDYSCYASPQQPAYSFLRSNSTITNIIVSTNTATATMPNHGLHVGNRLVITGATVDIDLNGTYLVLTVADANTLTFTTAGVANATYTDATLAVTTRDTRSSAAIWTVMQILYTSSNPTVIRWSDQFQICDNRATLYYH
jgi:hypothetical protein